MFKIIHQASLNPLKCTFIRGLQKCVSPVTTFGVYHKESRNNTRTLSSHNHYDPSAFIISKDERRKFMDVFPDIVRKLTEKVNEYDSTTASKWFGKALQYNVLRGKQNRGLLIAMMYKQLVDKNDLTPDNIRLAHYLGWCLEMLQCTLLIIDDIMDGSITRRGQPCWYKVAGVGLAAINDSLMIRSAIFYILKQHFSHTNYYVNLLELFHEIIFITTVGQSLDELSSNSDVRQFKMDNYKLMASNKTSYCSFYLPFALAMHMVGITDVEAFRQTKILLLEIGQLFQIQDDYLDCFGDPAITGKIGTDIENNKCSWLAVMCMQRASEKQKTLMLECYGQEDLEKVAKVKQLYKDLGLRSTYAIYEVESYNMIKTHIAQTSCGIPHDIFYNILDQIYQRYKCLSIQKI